MTLSYEEGTTTYFALSNKADNAAKALKATLLGGFACAAVATGLHFMPFDTASFCKQEQIRSGVNEVFNKDPQTAQFTITMDWAQVAQCAAVGSKIQDEIKILSALGALGLLAGGGVATRNTVRAIKSRNKFWNEVYLPNYGKMQP